MSTSEALTTFNIAGLSHHALAEAKLSKEAYQAMSVVIMDLNVVELRREPDNRFDRNAIEVYGAVRRPPEGESPVLVKLGYVPRQFALWMAKLLDSQVGLVARVEYADLASASLHVSVSRKAEVSP